MRCQSKPGLPILHKTIAIFVFISFMLFNIFEYATPLYAARPQSIYEEAVLKASDAQQPDYADAKSLGTDRDKVKAALKQYGAHEDIEDLKALLAAVGRAGGVEAVMERENLPALRKVVSELYTWSGGNLRAKKLSIPTRTDSLYRFAITPDGMRVATSGGDYNVHIWDIETGDVKLILRGHEGRVNGVAISSDGNDIVTASSDGTARVWDVKTGIEKLVVKDNENGILAVAITPDGTKFVTLSGDDALRVWNINTGQEEVVVRGLKNTIDPTVVISPDGSKIVTLHRPEGQEYGYPILVRIWDVEKKAESRMLGPFDNLRAVAITADSKQLIGVSEDGPHWILDLKTGEKISFGNQEHRYYMVFTSLNSREVLMMGDDGADGADIDSVQIWDVETGEEQAVLNTGESVEWMIRGHIWEIENNQSSLEVSQDGRIAVATSYINTSEPGRPSNERIWKTTAHIWYANIKPEFEEFEEGLFPNTVFPERVSEASLETEGEVQAQSLGAKEQYEASELPQQLKLSWEELERDYPTLVKILKEEETATETLMKYIGNSEKEILLVEAEKLLGVITEIDEDVYPETTFSALRRLSEAVREGEAKSDVLDAELLIAIAEKTGPFSPLVFHSLRGLGMRVKEGEVKEEVLDVEFLKELVEIMKEDVGVFFTGINKEFRKEEVLEIVRRADDIGVDQALKQLEQLQEEWERESQDEPPTQNEEEWLRASVDAQSLGNMDTSLYELKSKATFGDTGHMLMYGFAFIKSRGLTVENVGAVLSFLNPKYFGVDDNRAEAEDAFIRFVSNEDISPFATSFFEEHEKRVVNQVDELTSGAMYKIEIEGKTFGVKGTLYVGNPTFDIGSLAPIQLEELIGENISDPTVVAQIAENKGLKKLTLELSSFTELGALSTIPGLETLDLNNSTLGKPSIDDIGNIKSLKKLSLEEVLYMQTENLYIDDVDMDMDEDLGFYSPSFIGLSKLSKLEELNISLTFDATNDNLDELIEIKSLRKLNLSGNKYMTEYGRLSRLPKLEELIAKDAELESYLAIPQLVQIKGLKVLDLTGNEDIRELVELSELKELRSLILRRTSVTEEEIKELFQDPNNAGKLRDGVRKDLEVVFDDGTARWQGSVTDGQVIVAASLGASEVPIEEVDAQSLGAVDVSVLDRLKQSTNIFVHGGDINNFSQAQLDEIFKLAARNPKQLQVVVTNAPSYDKHPLLNLPNIHFTPRSAKEAAKGIRKAQHNLHLSKTINPSDDFTLVGDNKFRYPDEENGLLGVALLYTQSDNQIAFLTKYGLRKVDGFFSAVGEALLALVQSHEADLAIARAA